ncbi:MAG: TetR/AcrR family transcriptional regulator [Eubacteriales bacterium]|nr:TetR/AcrR family transcriptional regulator [Eubacteriales bacterium]
MFERIKNKTHRNQFTRMCIGEALIALMQSSDFSVIRVSDIVRRAGVSRMTFYHYYSSKTDVLTDYLDEIISLYLKESRQQPDIGGFRDYRHILFSLKFFDRYRCFFLTLTHAGLHSLIINAINDFMLRHFSSDFDDSIYKLYVYAGALLNVFLKWEEDGRSKPAEETARIIHDTFGSLQRPSQTEFPE